MDILQLIFDFISEWIWLPILIIYSGVIITVLIENGDPTKTLAWLMVIIFIPVIGIILYYFFGQKFVKEKKIKKLSEKQSIRMEEELAKLTPLFKSNLEKINHEIGSLSKVFQYIKSEKVSNPTRKNQVKLHFNGEEKFADLIIDLENAKHSIHLEYYIFCPDNIGLKILNILEKKASQGIKVRLIVDSFGSPELVKYMSKLKNSLIEFQEFLPITFVSLADSNYRNHRKIIVIDGIIGYIGGINISDKYLNSDELNNEMYWRDSSIRIKGKAVHFLQINYWHSWNQTNGEEFDLNQGYIPTSESDQIEGSASISFVDCNPSSIAPYNMEALLVAISKAKESIQLVTPYYIPSDELETALCTAAASGVNVELMLPAKSDSYIVRNASRSFIKTLLKRGVKVYFYNKGFIHAKTANFDGKLTFIGTVNLDIRSFYINYEIAAVVADKELCKQSVNDFEKDKLDSKLLTLQYWKSQPRWKKILYSICRLLSPLL